MKKLVYGIIAILILVLISAGCGMVVPEMPEKKIPNGSAGNSNIAHLYLFEKDPATWEIVEGGAWGKMQYKLSGETFDFVFNGHNLEPGLEYILIYYPDPWPGIGLICLGNGIVNEEGDIHIAASVNTGDLPAPYDENIENGAKIWLVLSSDVDCRNQEMIGWHPTDYLFEYDLIIFDSTTLVVTQNSGQNDINRENDWPHINWEINGLCITLEFVNPTPWYFVFDYRVDGEEGELHTYSNILINEGELAGEYIGEKYNWVVLAPNTTSTIEVCVEEEIWVGMRLGAEQNYYLDWIIFDNI